MGFSVKSRLEQGAMQGVRNPNRQMKSEREEREKEKEREVVGSV